MRKMAMVKKVLAIVLASAMAAGAAACTSSASSASSSSAVEVISETTVGATSEASVTVDESEVQEVVSEYPLNPEDEYFGISLPMISSEYYKGVQNELSQYCEEFGIEYDIASADADSQKQLSQFENFMTMGCTTIIVYALDMKAMQDIMERAENEGIRVVSATMTPDNVASFDIAVNASQTAVGTAAAQYAADWIDENYPDAADGSVEVCLFTMSISDNSNERCDAFDQVEQFTSKAKIVEEYDIAIDNFMVKVKENADLMMQQHPDVKVIMTYSDAFNIIIDEAMMANPDIDTAGVCSVAIDKTQATMEKIKTSADNQSTIRATVATGENFNRTLIEAALGAFDDQLDSSKTFFIDPFVITADNVDEYLQ